ncbi:hypothetical protein ANANG_G00122670 [Anguilla anguilla]|uniref:GOLD domain-containing protein n=1 Tax=Anguilla anguilla TaxID=7936 RepID=A0A9D3RZI7_ANGAN|nr:hypothetical protein ANANG_G00122670 [Anguilla anguilla]
MAALNAQTAVQFQQYAAQQYPENPEQQQVLIRQLQEQHYQQYMQQLYQVQLAQQQVCRPAPGGCSAEAAGRRRRGRVISGGRRGAALPAEPDVPTLNGQPDEHSESLDREPEAELGEELTENGPIAQRGATPVFEDHVPAGTYGLASDQEPDPAPVIAAPSMWTRPQIKDFKEKIRQDADSVITVGRGEVVTVRVPTHEEGSYLFWEFATDHYDVGFGVYFEWTNSPNTAVSVHVSESSDDEEDEEGASDTMTSNKSQFGEAQSEEEKAKKNANKPQVDEIVPVYRRDCHEEVYAGSHQYPGRGVYLLKFDNSYSLWRSKAVYYRVYYTR